MCSKVQLVSEEPDFRQALRFLIERESDLVVVHEAGDAREARAGGRTRPDVVLLDTSLRDVFAVGRTIRRGRLVFLSGRPSADEVRHALAAGAAGFVSKLQAP